MCTYYTGESFSFPRIISRRERKIWHAEDNLKISTLTDYRKLILTQIGCQFQGQTFTYPKLLYNIALIFFDQNICHGILELNVDSSRMTIFFGFVIILTSQIYAGSLRMK